MPVSSTTAELQAQRNGNWTTLYTLFVRRPAVAPATPDFVRGEVHGATATIGVVDPVEFRLPSTLPPGSYRIEREYGYGPSGKRVGRQVSGRLSLVR